MVIGMHQSISKIPRYIKDIEVEHLQSINYNPEDYGYEPYAKV